ncbi:cyclin-I2 isoform X3 [Diceros bicornis minor]|uniref:cyclin-I2 isoform X3 n=1 Tax=Diceros bicornis minor TaxID=77932 RepID=UPI0026F09BA4|nr:cyclin-I2 isoform X3 [Diceros bicornis minor]
MDSGARLSPQPSASEVSSVSRPDETALCCLLPPPAWNISLPAATRRFPEACQSGGAWIPVPSARGPQWGAAPAPRAAGPAPEADVSPQPPQQLFGPEGRRVPCDWGGLLDERRLVAHLKLALGREARLWRGGQPQVEICDAFQEVVLQLLRLKNIFHFSQSTFNLALTIFSRLLVSVKVKERLLQCVTITSLRLAVKVNEEEEVCIPGGPLWAAFELIPRIKDFIKHYGSGYTPNELLRMELAILDKLHWDLYIGTPLDFLTIFHALVVLGWPHVVELLPQRNPSLHVASLTRQLQHCMAGHQLLQFKGSTLALVIITLELERLMPDWCTPISDLLKKAQISIEQLSRCMDLVKQQLRSF